MALFAHFEKRSEKFGLFFKLQLKIQTVFGLKTFGMLITFHSGFFSDRFSMWPGSFLILEAKQESKVIPFFRLWKLKTDFSFLVTRIQTVLFSDRFQTERKSVLNIYLDHMNANNLPNIGVVTKGLDGSFTLAFQIVIKFD